MYRLALLVAMALLAVFGGSIVGSATAGAAELTDENVTIYRAADGDLDGVGDIEAGIADESIESVPSMVENDTIVVSIDNERLAIHYEQENGTTDAFFSFLEADEQYLSLYQASVTRNMIPAEKQFGPENTTVYRDGTTLYAVIEPPLPTAATRFDDSEFEIRYRTSNHVYSSDPTVEIHESSAEVLGLNDGDPLPTEQVGRSVDVHVPPDDTVEVRLEFDSDTTRIVPVESVDWASKDGFSVDLQDVEPGTTYTLELYHDGDVVDSYSGEVKPLGAELDVHVENESNSDDTESTRETVTVSGTLSHGGTILLTDPSDDTPITFESVRPGERETVVIPFSMVADRDIHVSLERRNAAIESHYPNASPAAIVHEDGQVEQYDPTAERSGLSDGGGEDDETDELSGTENETRTDSDTDTSGTDEPSGTENETRTDTDTDASGTDEAPDETDSGNESVNGGSTVENGTQSGVDDLDDGDVNATVDDADGASGFTAVTVLLTMALGVLVVHLVRKTRH